MERNSYTNLVWGLDGSRYYFDEITRNNWFEKYFEDSAEKIREFTKQAIDKAFEKEKIKMRKDQKIIITTDGKTTTARMFDGKELIKSAEAKCHPDDEFDFETGAKVAFDRLISKEKSVYYNGIVKCIKEDVAGRFRVSKVYKVVDGYFVNPDGERQYTDHAPYKSISEANFWIVARFAEVTPKTLLTNGVFGKSKEWGWFVVINDSLVFEKGGMTDISHYDDDLRISFNKSVSETIEIIVKAASFNDAKKERNVIWRRK